jgi:inner membrane transporter RhtA
MSLAPAIAATAGFLILGQRLGVLQLVAIGLVVIASAGAIMSSRRPLPLSEPTAAAS